MPLTPEDVRNKRFTVTRFRAGYDEEEVDAFLDEVEAELQRLTGERAPGAATPPATEPLAATPPAATPPATEPPGTEPPPGPVDSGPGVGPEAALRTLMLAQRTADEAVAQARTEADQILSAARAKAGELARQEQQEHVERLSALQRERKALEQRVNQLRAFEADYRERLRAHLQERLRQLDAQPELAPTGGPPPIGSPGPPTRPDVTPVAVAPWPAGQPRPAGQDPTGNGEQPG